MGQQSRVENILRATIDGTTYEIPAGSRVEELLLELKELLEEGGGGGGGGGGGVTKAYVDEQIAKIVVKMSTFPSPSAELSGKIYQYTGTTTSTLTHGYFYECKSDGSGGYEWSEIPVSKNEPETITPQELAAMWNN